MPVTGFTVDDVSPTPFLEPLPAHHTSTQKAPPGVTPSPLDSSFLCLRNDKWGAKDFIVTFFSDAESTVEMKVNLFDCIKETLDKYLQKKVEQDKRLYLPPNLVPTGKKQIQKVGRTFAYLPTLPLSSEIGRQG